MWLVSTFEKIYFKKIFFVSTFLDWYNFCATEPVFRCIFCDLRSIFVAFFVLKQHIFVAFFVIRCYTNNRKT